MALPITGTIVQITKSSIINCKLQKQESNKSQQGSITSPLSLNHIIQQRKFL